MTDLEIGWFIGLFEGEGSCCSTGGHYRNDAQISISQHVRCREVLDRIVTLTGKGKVYGPYGSMCRWMCTKRTDVKELILLMYPHLSIRRKEQVQKVLDLFDKKCYTISMENK